MECLLGERDQVARAASHGILAKATRTRHRGSQGPTVLFFTQWLELKHYANDRGVAIIGDLPIFVAADSADVWASPRQFVVDEECRPTVVAGVPPDYFSATGQRWGNPVYNWQAMRQDYFTWWVKRFEGTRTLVDIIRVDHFRGFEAGWTIPASEETAINGEWIQAPGEELFREVKKRLGELPIIAEDLGLITPAVEQLRVNHEFPGMKVLQFAFDSLDHGSTTFLPHNHEPSSVVYTGTHDNDTTIGWYEKCSEQTKERIEDYHGTAIMILLGTSFEWHWPPFVVPPSFQCKMFCHLVLNRA